MYRYSKPGSCWDGINGEGQESSRFGFAPVCGSSVVQWVGSVFAASAAAIHEPADCCDAAPFFARR
jgi:hypothetical protein